MTIITGATKVHGLFGTPVAYSLSPVIFNRTFQKLGLDRTYVPFDVPTENLKDAVEAARVLSFAGFNVTMPHKTAIVELLDVIDRSAERAGAVNTVARTPRGLSGHNTDGEGAFRALKAYGFNPNGKRILVIGAGGAARSIVDRMSREKNDVRILNRTLAKARSIADATGGHGRVTFGELTRKNLEGRLRESDLIVNTTPVQTPSLIQQLGVPISALDGNAWVFDLAYDRVLEPLPGVVRVSPLEMLVQQAALSFEVWSRKPAPFQIMRSVLVDFLGRDWK